MWTKLGQSLIEVNEANEDILRGMREESESDQVYTNVHEDVNLFMKNSTHEQQ